MREIKFRAWDKCQKHWSGMRDVFIHSGIYYFNVDIKDVALMQYTGLKDKNGKEIYEGDILQNEAKHMGKVEWYEPHALYILRLPNDTYDLWQIPVERTEVIGNIYENKELLGK